MQKNWIGKSFGCEIDFPIEGSDKVDSINVTLKDQIHFLDFHF